MPIQVQLLSQRVARRAASGAGAGPALALSETQQRYLERFRQRVERGEYRFVYEACPCGAGGAERDVCVAEIDRYGLEVNSVLCLACGTVRIDPYLDEPSLDHFYTHLYQELYGRKNSLPNLFAYQRQNYGERIADLYRNQLAPGSAVLEVGCGTGGAVAVFADRGYATAGCDFSRELIEYGTQQGVPNLWSGTVADAPSELAGRRYDLIYLFHVLEHVRNPAESLRELSQRLAPGGRILAVVPDLSRIDSHRNPGGDVRKFLHIAHKYNYSATALEQIARAAGLSGVQPKLPVCDEAELVDARHFPELWVEFKPVAANQMKSGGASASGPEALTLTGRQMLEYLAKTERNFLAGTTSAQLAIARRTGQIAAVQATILPQPSSSTSEANVSASTSQETVRVFIGSGEASLLERRALIHSLRKNSRRKIDVYVLNGTHNAIEKNDEPPFLAPMSLRVKYRNYTEFSLYRYLIPQLCGHQGRGIYLDSDMLCLGDIGELFDMPMHGADFLSIKAYDTGQWGPSVMLIDCSTCRFDLEQICDEIDAGKFTYSEFTRMDDRFLAHHPLKIGVLDPNWNVFDRCDERTKLIHYTNLMSQPWKFPGHPQGELWFGYFREAIAAGVLSEEDVTKAITRGYVRPTIREGNGEAAPPAPSQVRSAAARNKKQTPTRKPSWLKRLSRKLRGKAA